MLLFILQPQCWSWGWGTLPITQHIYLIYCTQINAICYNKSIYFRFSLGSWSKAPATAFYAAVAPLRWTGGGGRGLVRRQPIASTHDQVGGVPFCDWDKWSNAGQWSTHGHCREPAETRSIASRWGIRHKTGPLKRLTMVSLDHVAHRILSYIPYVLVLVDLRYEGKEPSASDFFTRKAA